jgi:hypothetical protein
MMSVISSEWQEEEEGWRLERRQPGPVSTMALSHAPLAVNLDRWLGAPAGKHHFIGEEQCSSPRQRQHDAGWIKPGRNRVGHQQAGNPATEHTTDNAERQDDRPACPIRIPRHHAMAPTSTPSTTQNNTAIFHLRSKV